MAVGFDAVGPAGGAGTAFTATPGTWTHVNTGNGILVGITCFGGTSNTVTGVTYGGVTIPFLGYINTASPGAGTGGISVYGLVGATCPTGSNTVSVAFSDAGSNHNASSVSVSGAGSLGTVFSNDAAVTLSISVNVTGTTAGGLVVAAACFGGGSGGGTFTGTGGVTRQAQKWTSNTTGSDNLAMGTVASPGGTEAAGFTSNAVADDWGIIAVEVLPGATAIASPPAGVRPPGRKSPAVLSRMAPARVSAAQFVTAVTGTVTANVGPGGVLLRVWVFTGQGSPALSALHGTFTTHASSQAIQASIVTTVTGSRVYGVMEENNTNTTFAALAGTTLVDNQNDANAACYATLKATALTGTPGATAFGTATAFTSGSVALAEILPGTGLAEDPSAPSSVWSGSLTAVTSPAFAPPPGALLLAAFAGEGDGVNIQTASMADARGLAWTPVVFSCVAASGFSGLWAATVPVPGAPGSLPPALLTPFPVPVSDGAVW